MVTPSADQCEKVSRARELPQDTEHGHSKVLLQLENVICKQASGGYLVDESRMCVVNANECSRISEQVYKPSIRDGNRLLRYFVL